MGRYCTGFMRRHPARMGEIMEARRFSPYGRDVALFGDKNEIACIPHKGCRLEIAATADERHREIKLLLPGQVLRYTRSFFFGDRLALPSGKKVGLWECVGFKFELAPAVVAPPPAEEAIVQRARDKFATVRPVPDHAPAGTANHR